MGSAAPGGALRRVPALDGVRGLAVAAVVAFHLGLHQLRGGLLGVDVFFVLSGYLITGLVLQEWRAEGDVSLTRFWGRRARRLLPALLLVLVAVAAGSRVLLAPDQQPAVRGDLLATLFYVANWHSILAGHGYFAAFGAPSPLLHTWSLAVEEQFYLLWPLGAVIALRRLRSSRWLLAISAAGAAVSASWMLALSLAGTGTDRLYYGSDTRAQALFVGDALAGLLFAAGFDFTGARLPGRGESVAPPGVGGGRRRGAGALRALGLAGAAVVVWMWLRADGQSTWLYRGGFLLVAVSVAAVIASVILEPGTRLARVLGLRPLTALGTISYGVYLWHWPVIVVLTRQRTGLTAGPLLALRLGATLAVSVASFHLLELPIRARRLRIPRPAVAVPCVLAGVAVLAVVLPRATSPSPPALAAAAAAPLPPPPLPAPPGTAAQPAIPLADAEPAVTAPATTVPATPPVPAVTHPGPLRVMVVGDSVASSLGVGIAPLQAAAGIAVSNQGYIGCGIARGGATSFKAYTQPPACLTWPERWQGLVDSFRPDVTLVLLGRWEVLDRVHDGQWMHIGQPAFDAYLRSELDLATTTLTSRGGRVAFLTAPCNNHELADLASPGRLPPDDQHRVDLFNQLQADTAAAHPGWTTVVPFADLLCPNSAYQGSVAGVPLRTSDGVHLQPLAGRLFVQQQLPPLLAWLRQPAPTT